MIPAGSLSGAVAVTGVPDLNAEGNETVIVHITAVTGGRGIGDAAADRDAPRRPRAGAHHSGGHWWQTDPELQNREDITPVESGPHYWTKDESDQFLFVTSTSGGAAGPAYLYSIPDLVAAHADNVVTPVASVATAAALGVSSLRGGAVSDDLGRVLSGTSYRADPGLCQPADGRDRLDLEQRREDHQRSEREP